MRVQPRILVNTPHIELWPGGLLRARSNRDARILASAQRVFRRKRDGRYLAALGPDGLQALIPRLAWEPGLTEATAATSQHFPSRPGLLRVAHLPLDRLQDRLEGLGLDDSYGQRTGLPLVAEPGWLAFAGKDRFGRPLWLHPLAALAWKRMRDAASAAGVHLDAISGYRSHDYQLGIFERKRERGQTVEQILAVNAAPGYSEHHSGLALDVGTPGEPPAEESFEQTAAFEWLSEHAGDHGFAMSYPRDNPHGIVYEPWHWRFGPSTGP